MQPADYLVHFSNILLLVAYSVRDILWLRWFAVAAALTNIPYFLVQDVVLWPPVLWASVFTAINLYQIARIYRERRPVVLSADQQTLYDLAFHSLRPRDFLSLALVGEWCNAEAGERLLTAGDPAARVSIAISGDVEVYKGETDVGRLAPGHLVGTGLVLTGTPSPVDARFVTPGRYIRWSTQTLRVFLDKRPDLREALQRVTSRDLAAKLERAIALPN
jgi:CRP-like cAMP-binding protein